MVMLEDVVHSRVAIARLNHFLSAPPRLYSDTCTSLYAFFAFLLTIIIIPDLEFLCRSQCRNLRIVKSLAGEAHLLIIKFIGPTSLAIRMYYADETSSEAAESLGGFFQTYQMAIVFVVASFAQDGANTHHTTAAGSTATTGATITQSLLNDAESLFQVAQERAAYQAEKPQIDEVRASVSESFPLYCNPQPTSRTPHPLYQNGKRKEKLSRVYIVPTAEAALAMIVNLEIDLSKSKKRHLYYQRQMAAHFVPPNNTANAQEHQRAAMVHVAEALRKWADRYELPPGEINVLMSLMGTLGNISKAGRLLENAPVEERTKQLVCAFFGRPELPPTQQSVVENPDFMTPPPGGMRYHSHHHASPQRQYPAERMHPDRDEWYMDRPFPPQGFSPHSGLAPVYVRGMDPPLVAHSMPGPPHHHPTENTSYDRHYHHMSGHYVAANDPPLVRHSLPPQRQPQEVNLRSRGILPSSRHLRHHRPHHLQNTRNVPGPLRSMAMDRSIRNRY